MTLPIDRAPYLNQPGVLTDPDAAYLAGTALPGNPGVAAIAAHSQWGNAKGIFAGLGALTPGTPVALTDQMGVVTNWRIEEVFEAPKGHLPDWLWAPNAVPLIALITCGGAINPATRLHADNIVVVAAPA